MQLPCTNFRNPPVTLLSHISLENKGENIPLMPWHKPKSMLRIQNEVTAKDAVEEKVSGQTPGTKSSSCGRPGSVDPAGSCRQLVTLCVLASAAVE